MTRTQRHQRREAKAARRRKRLAAETPGQRKARQDKRVELAGQGVERLNQATKNAPKDFGKAKPKADVGDRVVEIGRSLVKRLRPDEQEDRVAA